ncbi:zinc ribbon domain-containing protein [Pontiella sp.]
MAGGMIKDVLHEADLNLGGKPEKIIMLKCPACGTLNEENSKFCQECGQKI